MNASGSEVLAPSLVQLTALATEPTITRAAKRAGTSQPTLSRALMAWERQLGIALVDRTGRSAQLTDAGRSLALAAATCTRMLDEAVSRLGGGESGRTLTVGFLRSLGPTVAAELIAAFLAVRRDTVIRHKEGSTAALCGALDAGGVDIIITAPRPALHYGWVPLGQQSLVLTVASGHPLATASTVALASVRDEPFLTLDPQFDTRQRADALCAAAGFSPKVVLEADDVVTIRGYVASGMGVAILPVDATPSPRTVSLPIEDDGACRTFGLAWDPARATPETVALIGRAEELSARYPGWADLSA
jgi:DNA-binding transcriptional LysR family regulator